MHNLTREARTALNVRDGYSDQLFHIVNSLLGPSISYQRPVRGWEIEMDMSGAWCWVKKNPHNKEEVIAGYATPWWENEPGIQFALLDGDGDTGMEAHFDFEPGANIIEDARRLILIVTSQLELLHKLSTTK